MADNEKIIQFPGLPGHGSAKKPPIESQAAPLPDIAGAEEIPAEVLKALGIIQSGLPFVIVGIRPTATGADFISTAYGDKTDLRNALPHLADMQARALSRYGVE